MQVQSTTEVVGGAESPVKRFFRVAEVAARFEVDKTTVYRLVKAGRLEAIRVGKGRGVVRVPAESLARYEASIAAAAVAGVA